MKPIVSTTAAGSAPQLFHLRLVWFETGVVHAALGLGVLHEGIPDKSSSRILGHQHGDARVDTDDVCVIPVESEG